MLFNTVDRKEPVHRNKNFFLERRYNEKV